MYRMKEEREITPKTFTHLLSSTLYEKRYAHPAFSADVKIWSVVPGASRCRSADSDRARPKPKAIHFHNGHACSRGVTELTDSIGCITTPKDFAVAGTAQDKLYGMAEGLWEPDLVGNCQLKLAYIRNQRICSKPSPKFC